MTDTLWKEDAAQLAAILADGRGAMLWERSSDGRWYLAGTIRSLFDEDILELRWGGAGKNPSRIIRQSLESADLKALANGICRRRRQHGYVPSPRHHGNDTRVKARMTADFALTSRRINEYPSEIQDD